MSASIISFVAVLGILILVHEFGHFIVARLAGVGVVRFSLGFGPRIVGKKIGITDYCISAFPLGGYVKMVGESESEEVSEEEKNMSFSEKSVVRRVLIIAAGPVFNLVLAILIFFGYFAVSGLPVLLPEIGTIQEDRPAAKQGVQPNDLITSINGAPVESWEDMAVLVNESEGGTLRLEIHRAKEIVYLDVMPEMTRSQNLFGEEIDRYVIGVTPSGQFETKDLNLFQSFGESLFRTWEISRLTFLSIVKMIQGKLSAEALGGPIMIAQMAGEQAKAGAASLIFFVAFLSIELGLLNLLPIPVLDGGHLAFLLIETVTGKPVNAKIRDHAQRAGMCMLGLLMMYVVYNDLMRIFSE